MGLCVRQQWFVFPRAYTATEREILKLHLTVIVYVLCILYSLLFRYHYSRCAPIFRSPTRVSLQYVLPVSHVSAFPLHDTPTMQHSLALN
jgi:hypothetical protein